MNVYFKKHLFPSTFQVLSPTIRSLAAHRSAQVARGSPPIRSLARSEVRSPPIAPRRSLPVNCTAQVSPRQSRLAGLSPPIAPRRSPPANRAAQVSPRQLRRTGLYPSVAPRRPTVSPRQSRRAGLSPPIAPRRSLPANRAAQVSPRQLESESRRAGLRSLPANRSAVYGAINAMAAMDIVQD